MLKGLAADGGLFLPEEVPFVTDWVCTQRPTFCTKYFLLRYFLSLSKLFIKIKANAKHCLKPSWKDLSYAELAFKIFSLYISTDEIPADDLKAIIDRSYSTFRAPDITPLVHLQDNLYLLELFHGPSYSFKDCAL